MLNSLINKQNLTFDRIAQQGHLATPVHTSMAAATLTTVSHGGVGPAQGLHQSSVHQATPTVQGSQTQVCLTCVFMCICYTSRTYILIQNSQGEQVTERTKLSPVKLQIPLFC